MIQKGDSVVAVLTGHVLKDPDAIIGYHNNTLDNISARYPNHLHESSADIDSLARILTRHDEAIPS